MLLSEKFRVKMLDQRLDMLTFSLNIFYWATLKKAAEGSCEMLVNNNVPGDMSENFDIRKCGCQKINGRHTPFIIITYHSMEQSTS